MPSILFVAPVSTDSIFKSFDSNLDMRFVLILNYKHVRTAGLTVHHVCVSLSGTTYILVIFMCHATSIEQSSVCHPHRDDGKNHRLNMEVDLQSLFGLYVT
jgi:hypothetical protein